MIEFDLDGTHYKLEVTAATIKQMERGGVNFAKLGDSIIAAEVLWKGMFIAHHNSVPDAKRMQIYNALSSVADGEEPELDENGDPVDMLMSVVGDEYKGAIEALGRAQGNVPWKRS